ncbi:MAG: AAA family ATPase, partial [Dermatophilaceae bacterium]
MTEAGTRHLLDGVMRRLERVVVGKAEPLRLVLSGILAGGHVLLEDVPGVGKTLAAKALAANLGLVFSRIQFTPDMLPSDVTGAMHFDPRSSELVFRPGPLFAGLVLADEINRAPAKTQAALLQAMAEHQVSVDGVTHDLPAPFHVVATANPVEYDGTFPLPEAQLDRFHLCAALGYPDPVSEAALVRSVARTGRASPVAHPDEPGVQPVDLRAAQAQVRTVEVSEEIVDYVVTLVRSTRDHEALALGASPRGSLALTQCSQAHAMLCGRDFVTPDDVQMLAAPVLAHRLSLRPELWGSRVDVDQVVRDVVAATPAPDARG